MILVVGDVMTDVIVRPRAAPAHGTDCPAAIETQPGGSGANVACWIASLGGHAAFAGRVGRADAGAHKAALQEHGVRAHLAIDDDRPTGRVVAILDPDGERSFYTDRGANLGLCATDLPEMLLQGVSALHVGGHVFHAEQPREAARALMATMRARGGAVSVDAGSAAYLARCGRDAFLAWTEEATLCFANQAESDLLGQELPFATYVVTLGAGGALAYAGEEWHVMRVRTATAADSTGAGDAAAAGFLVARTQGLRITECLSSAMTAARSAIATIGGRPPASCNGHATLP